MPRPSVARPPWIPARVRWRAASCSPAVPLLPSRRPLQGPNCWSSRPSCWAPRLWAAGAQASLVLSSPCCFSTSSMPGLCFSTSRPTRKRSLRASSCSWPSGFFVGTRRVAVCSSGSGGTRHEDGSVIYPGVAAQVPSSPRWGCSELPLRCVLPTLGFTDSLSPGEDCGP